MDLPKIVAKQPTRVDLVEGQTYAYCSCGLSDKQPFCNGAHKGTGYAPKVFVAEATKTVSMCQCKHTKNPGFCDGSHKAL